MTSKKARKNGIKADVNAPTNEASLIVGKRPEYCNTTFNITTNVKK